MKLGIIKWLVRDLAFKYGVYLYGYTLFFASYLVAPFNKKLASELLLTSSRNSQGRLPATAVARRRNKILPYMIEILADEGKIPIRRAYHRSIVLKNPVFDGKEVEKGILLIKFTDTFMYYCCETNIKELLHFFDVILEPSWAGYALPEIIHWTQFTEGKILIEASEIRDFKLIESFESILKPVRFGSSDWVDYRIFRPLEVEKKYDVIYVANFNPVKRQHVYFKALAKLKKSGIKAALVCGQWGEGQKEINELIDYYGIKEVIDLYVELSPEELNKVLNQSKVNLLMTLKEGSNRSIFEGIFAGTPGIVLKNNIGMNKNYINEHTGKLIDERNLAETIEYFSSNWKRYDTRAWAMENISPLITTEKMLNEFYGEEAKLVKDVAVKVNKPEAAYMELLDSDKYLSSNTVVDIFRNLDASKPEYQKELSDALNIISVEESNLIETKGIVSNEFTDLDV